jgi:LysM repeat protein
MPAVASMRAAFLVSANCSGRSPLGTEGKSSRPRIARRLPAAVPALCGAAAAFALAGAPAAGAAVTAAPAAAHHRAAPAASRPAAVTPAVLLAAARPAGRHAAPPVRYAVRPGDTLSAIAQRFYHGAEYWPVLYWANHDQIRYADDIQVGQVLTVPARPARIPAAPGVLAPAPPVQQAPVQQAPVQQAQDADAPAAQAAPARATVAQAAPAAAPSGGESAFQACVIARESGGNSQVMNASGHYGLYQFSASTWAEYGGNPADFGNASVAEQNQVFDNAIAAGGQSNWSAYDGC